MILQREAPVSIRGTATPGESITVALSWSAVSGADYYSVWRTTLYENGVAGTYPLRTILLDDAVVDTSYTDNSRTDGKIGWLCDNSRPDHLHRSKQRQEWRVYHRQNAGASEGLLLQSDGCECRWHLAFGYDPFESQVI